MEVLWGVDCHLEKWEPPGGWNPSISDCDRVWAENYWRWLKLVKKLETGHATHLTMKELYKRRWNIL